MDEYDFLNLKESGIPTIHMFKKFIRFFIIFLIVISLLVFITADELKYEIIIFPLYTILVIGFSKWLFSRLIHKIFINDSEFKIELERKVVKILWHDIEHIYIVRKWGGTKLKIKVSNADINLPRRSFHLWAGSSSDEGEKLLVRALKKIGKFTELKFNNNMKNIIKFWNKYDV